MCRILGIALVALGLAAAGYGWSRWHVAQSEFVSGAFADQPARPTLGTARSALDAARTEWYITLGASVALVVAGGVVLWLAWPKSRPAARQLEPPDATGSS
jgi:hypothetical protein